MRKNGFAGESEPSIQLRFTPHVSPITRGFRALLQIRDVLQVSLLVKVSVDEFEAAAHAAAGDQGTVES